MAKRTNIIPVIEAIKLEPHEINALVGKYIVDTISPRKIKIYSNQDYKQIRAQLAAKEDKSKNVHIIQRVCGLNMAVQMLQRDHVSNHGRYCLEEEFSRYAHRVEDAKLRREAAAAQGAAGPANNVDLSEFEDDAPATAEKMAPIDLSEFGDEPKGKKPKK